MIGVIVKKEIWKDIPNYSGYQVSNLGRVRTYNKTTYTEKHGIRHWKNRILKQKLQQRENKRKDYRVELWNEGKHKTFLVARLVAFTFLNKDINNSKLTINHIDGNSANNNIDNLEIVTLKENIQHAFNNNLGYQKNIVIENKETKEKKKYNSLAKGSLAIFQNRGYLSGKIKKGIFENKCYKWNLL